MTYLLINTATEIKELALGNNFKNSTEWEKITWQDEASDLENILPALDELLKKTKTGIRDLEAIYVIEGPGSFTALRLGLITANTLAGELKIPIKTLQTDKYVSARLGQKFDFTLLKAGGPSVHVFTQNSSVKPELVVLADWLKTIEFNSETKIATDFTVRLQEIWNASGNKATQLSTQNWLPLSACWQNIVNSATDGTWPIMPAYFKEPKIG